MHTCTVEAEGKKLFEISGAFDSAWTDSKAKVTLQNSPWDQVEIVLFSVLLPFLLYPLLLE